MFFPIYQSAQAPCVQRNTPLASAKQVLLYVMSSHPQTGSYISIHTTSVVLGSVVHGGISSSFLHMVSKNRKRSVYSLIYWLLQTLCVFVIVIQIKWKCQWKPYQKKRGKIGEKSFCRYRFYTAFVNDKHQKGRCCNSQISI